MLSPPRRKRRWYAIWNNVYLVCNVNFSNASLLLNLLIYALTSGQEKALVCNMKCVCNKLNLIMGCICNIKCIHECVCSIYHVRSNICVICSMMFSKCQLLIRLTMWIDDSTNSWEFLPGWNGPQSHSSSPLCWSWFNRYRQMDRKIDRSIYTRR